MFKLIKIVLVLGVLAVGGFLAYRYLITPPHKRACARLSELCSTGLFKAKIDNCEGLLADVEKAAGKQNAKRAVECLNEATTCVGAAGCVVGAGVKAVGGAMGEFLEGVKRVVK